MITGGLRRRRSACPLAGSIRRSDGPDRQPVLPSDGTQVPPYEYLHTSVQAATLAADTASSAERKAHRVYATRITAVT